MSTPKGGSMTALGVFENMTGFLIVDDHPMVRAALEVALQRAYPEASVHQAGSLPDAETALSSNRGIDMVLLDLNIPGIDGLEGLTTLRARFPRTPVLVVSGYDDTRFRTESHAAGAAGFVSKAAEPEQTLEAIATVLAGDNYWPADTESDMETEDSSFKAMLATLTPQQLRVLELLGQGLLNKQIAFELDIAESTGKAHVSAILRKLNVNSRTQAVLLAQKMRFS
jgi:DNA-binding NarL/FixJ family response regulator